MNNLTQGKKSYNHCHYSSFRSCMNMIVNAIETKSGCEASEHLGYIFTHHFGKQKTLF